MKSERVVTTIGDLGHRPTTFGLPASVRSRFAHRRGPRIFRPFMDHSTDGLNRLFGIGEMTVDREGGEIVIVDEPEGEGPGTFTIPEVVIVGDVPKKPAAGAPSAAVPSKAAWSRGDGTYIVQRGDTLFGLGVTYLLSGNRWREIWNAQPANVRASRDPNRIFEGELFLMPQEAQARARQMGLFGIGANVFGRGFSKTQVALAGAAAVVLGTLVYTASS